MYRHVPAAGVAFGYILAYRASLFGLALRWGGSFGVSVAVGVSLRGGSVCRICREDG